MARGESKNKHQTHTCRRKIGLRVQNLLIVLDAIVNVIEEAYTTV